MKWIKSMILFGMLVTFTACKGKANDNSISEQWKKLLV